MKYSNHLTEKISSGSRTRCAWQRNTKRCPTKTIFSLFLNYLNTKHCNIKFTMECESNNKLSFLDCPIHKHDNKFECSVYRKNTFTGLGLSYFSNCSFIFKLNCVRTLLSRANRVCSCYAALHSEFDFLKKFFQSNGYCTSFIENQIGKFLSRKFYSVTTKNSTADVPNDQPVFLSIPYFGPYSEKLKN